jgi:uncharacterized membrane protein YraQ (UPF0718 family)/YHS domain-containing protein
MIIHMLGAIGESLRMAFFMFWDTLWALVLGFGLSGAVQAFVARAEMQRALGGHRLPDLVRATLFGAASSSCSYAASAMAKSLFQKGADFISAMAFMFASTNLVIELGLVLWVLIGWQFTAAEFVGGLIMIGLFAALARFVLRPELIEVARKRLEASAVEMMGDASHVHAHASTMGELSLQQLSWRKRLLSKAGWADAASYALADMTMLRKEMLIGYVVAGFLAVLVPTAVWNEVFLRGHGFWTSLENVMVGPFIALISFVCSVGNVPLAAALWKGGIGFGGVVSFIFADLISLPLLLIYRKFYGWRLVLRLLVLFWTCMSAAGLAVQYLFQAAGLVPMHRSLQIVTEEFRWNETTILNLIFLGVFVLLYWLRRNQARFGGGAGYAIDPVCGMQVQIADAPAVAEYEGRTFYFCSDRCRERFAREPERYTRAASSVAADQ